MSFYLALHTGTDYTSESYDEAAGVLLNLMCSILSDKDKLASLTSGAGYSKTKVEIEASLQDEDTRELIVKAVIDFEGSDKLKFDKSKFTKMVRGHADYERWPQLKIFKKAVDPLVVPA